jgi:hypothetical protein
VQVLTGPLPKLTNDKNDPRYDPVLNARATAALMVINRKRLLPTVQNLGQKEPTLGQLYSAHNLGASRTIEMITKAPSEWSKKTEKAILNQAEVLKEGGVSKYFTNAEVQMSTHYEVANRVEESVPAAKVASGTKATVPSRTPSGVRSSSVKVSAEPSGYPSKQTQNPQQVSRSYGANSLQTIEVPSTRVADKGPPPSTQSGGIPQDIFRDSKTGIPIYSQG